MQNANAFKIKKQAVYIEGKDRTDEIESYIFEGGKYKITYKSNGKTYNYHPDKIEIIKSAIQSEGTDQVFNYLKSIAEEIGLIIDGRNILESNYSKLSFIPETTVLYNYLNGVEPAKKEVSTSIDIFPFGFNLNQEKGVREAFSNSISVVEGPPGTGKTQTILNIIANALLQNKSVAVVSSNNSATKNVFEKLEKNGISFIAAILGNSENKKQFIEAQSAIPDLSAYQLSEEEKLKIEETTAELFSVLKENLVFKNELATLNLELESLITEFRHFGTLEDALSHFTFKRKIKSDALLSFWIRTERYEEKEQRIPYWEKIINKVRYSIKPKQFYELFYRQMIRVIQFNYYKARIAEINSRKDKLEETLNRFSFDKKMKEHSELSMRLLKHNLYEKYKKKERREYVESDLYFKAKDFIKDYPVIMSTTYSLRKSLAENVVYDYVIIDESSQVDLATGVLALSCAKNAVIVGDLKQLPNVVDSNTARKTEAIFSMYNIPEAYRYSTQSLLSSILHLFPNIARTLLQEHYRCHPKIIDFCNKKFYDNKLIILSEGQKEKEPLLIYKTTVGNHARERVNQRQIDVILEEIIPQQKLQNADLGIVTPYRNQSLELQKIFLSQGFVADTVDKFQGRENDVIILSTVDNEISEFTDNANRLNVAISRAKDQLILLINGNDSESDSNIADLVRYIEYNYPHNTIKSEIHSVFDYLYKAYEEKRRKMISNESKKSVYDSENLMYLLIREVLSINQFSKYDVVLHFPLRNLLSTFSKLSEEEYQYANHHATHLDFLLFNKLGKNPVLAIEVDGYEYHKIGSKQNERDIMKNSILEKYGIPLLRFSTTGSGEKKKLVGALNELVSK